MYGQGYAAPASPPPATSSGAFPFQLPTAVAPVHLDQPRTWHLPNWGRMREDQRIGILRALAVQRGRDPRIRALAAQIAAGLEQRDYAAQAGRLLAWVQEHIAYLNEPGEILQDPLYTLRVQHGDCDDMAILLGALYEALRLDFRFVLSGRDARGKHHRWVEGEPFPPTGIQWAHVYLSVGWPPFKPSTWAFAEPTIKGKPLGWDVHAAQGGGLPELGRWGATAASTGTRMISAGGGAAGATAKLLEDGTVTRQIAVAVTVGVLTSVASTLLIEAVKDWRAKGRK